MSKHRRKLALAAALVLLFGSAAASAANFASGRGAMPSFAGAGDALGLAMGGVVDASAWMASRSRNAVDDMLAYLRPSSARPAEVETTQGSLPRARSGSGGQAANGPLQHQPIAFAAEPPDRVHPASFEGRSAAPRQERVPSVQVNLPALPGGGGRGALPTTSDIVIPAIPEVTAPVPEPETYALFSFGLALIGWVARRRGKASGSMR